jgi:hypothetical protein
MTLQTPPSWLQAGSYPAQYDRLTAQALWATTGIIGASSLAVTENSPPGMSVRVALGWAAIVGTTTTNMGVYTIFNDATDTLTITTADPTNPRIDLVCATVRDAFYSGANNDVIFQVIAGTPAGSPVAPALPANSISLATIAVGAAVTQINTVNITDTRTLVTTNITEIGDISAVVAGTGLSGGGSSGSVTVSIDTAVTADLTTAQILTNKTLTSPLINVGINTQTGTTYTTVLADNGKLVTQSNASPITTTIAAFSSVAYPVGSQINFTQLGAGQLTIQGDTGVTIVSTGATASAPELRAQYSAATAICLASDSWLVIGDIV